MIYYNYQKWIVKIIDLSKEWVDFVVFYNQIIDRFEMTKDQNVSFERKFPDKANIS